MEIEDELALDGCEKILGKVEDGATRQSRENRRTLPSERVARSHSLNSSRSLPRPGSRERPVYSELSRGVKRDLSLDSQQEDGLAQKNHRATGEIKASNSKVSDKSTNILRDRSPHKLPSLDSAISGFRALTLRPRETVDVASDAQDKAEAAFSALKSKVRTQLGVIPRQTTISSDPSKSSPLDEKTSKSVLAPKGKKEEISKPLLSPSVVLSPSGGRTPRTLSPTQTSLNLTEYTKATSEDLTSRILTSPSLHISMLDHLPTDVSGLSPEGDTGKTSCQPDHQKADTTSVPECLVGDAIEDDQAMPRIMEETDEYFEYGDFDEDAATAHIDIMAFHEGVGDTLDQYEKDKIELEEKILEMRESHQKEIESLLQTMKIDQAKLQYEMENRDKEMLILKRECEEKERLANDLGSFQNALHDSAIKGSEQSKELHRLANENNNKDAKIKELHLILESIRSENSSLKNTLVKFSTAEMERAKRDELFKRSAAKLHQRHERVKRTTSIASLTNGGKSIMMMADDNEFEITALSDEMGRKALKDYSWPSISKVGSGEQYRRMIYKIVDEMTLEGISDKLIIKSLKATLIENDPALFGRLEGKHNPKSLEDMLKMLEYMDSRESTLTVEERFAQARQKDGEAALEYMDRLESLFDDLFGKDATGKLRRVKKLFLDTFNQKGVYLSENDKDAAEAHGTLIEVAMKAEQKMKRRSDALKQSRMATARFPQQQRPQLRQASPQPSINYVNNQQSSRDASAGAYQQTGATPRRPANVQSNQRMSAGPGAVRVSLREYQAGKADDNATFCYKCLQKNHVIRDCLYFPSCAFCNGQELYHWTRHHDEWLEQQNQSNIPRRTMQNGSA